MPGPNALPLVFPLPMRKARRDASSVAAFSPFAGTCGIKMDWIPLIPYTSNSIQPSVLLRDGPSPEAGAWPERPPDQGLKSLRLAHAAQ